jgi:hypothetical protein
MYHSVLHEYDNKEMQRSLLPLMQDLAQHILTKWDNPAHNDCMQKGFMGKENLLSTDMRPSRCMQAKVGKQKERD